MSHVQILRSSDISVTIAPGRSEGRIEQERSNLLLELKVKDLGIIEDIDWNPDSGLNVITGETGAGKSLVLDAVELLLTGMAGEDVIRHGAAEARVEGVFALSNSPRFNVLHTLLKEKGLTADSEDMLVIRCEIRKHKPGVVRINSQAVTKTILRQVGQLLIDIHGQSEHLSLLNKKYHLDFLDAFARTIDLRQDFAAKLFRFREMESEIKSLADQEKDFLRREEFFKYQIDEIKKASLRPGEDEDLEKEKHIISHSEKLREYSEKVYQAIYESDNASHFSASALSRVNEALQALKKLGEMDPALNPQLDYLEKTFYGLEEVARDVRAYGEKLDHDPHRLEEIESRLEIIRNLKRKYGKTIPEVLDYLERTETEMAGAALSSERRAQIEGELVALKTELGQIASRLSEARSQAAGQLVMGVKKELEALEMSQMQFAVSITQTESTEGIEGPAGKTCAFTADGIDNVEFMVSTNPGEPLKPLAKVASTGEISRFTLALKSALSEADNIPVMIFDEIDIGVGGRSGDILGKKLWALSRHHQVICVTHLPQIACYADAHYCVHKQTSGDRTTSILENLPGEARANELAAMLAGPNFTETALRNALELLQNAARFKES